MRALTIVLTVLLAFASNISIGNGDITPTEREQRDALDESRRSIEHMEVLELNMSRIINDTGGRKRRLHFFSPEALSQSRQAAVELGARQILSEKLNIPGEEIQFTSTRSARSGESTLPPLAPCNSSALYRTNDGSCNNLNNPRYGQALTINGRLLPANYADGISTPRRAISGNALPSPRLISTSVLIDESLYTCNGPSLLTMQFGQFFDHDFTFTPQFKTSSGGEITCCQGSNGQTGSVVPSSPFHPECLPIEIPNGDSVYASNTVRGCMEFIRSIHGVKLDGTTPRQREQINGVTHWIDGSMIYGTGDAQVLSLRNTSSGSGLMRTSIVNGFHHLPLSSSCCTGSWCSSTESCAEAGDFRATEQPLLTVMHTVWLREHNRIANELFRLNGTSKNDEYYFQQARRIVIAELQHIAYQEYLPVLLGELGVRLSVAQADAPKKPNPAILSEFTTAAYRMGHSQLKSFFRLFEADGRRSNLSYKLADSYFDDARVSRNNFLDNSLRGLLQVPVQEVDHSFPADVTSQLFRQQGATFGLDLVSLNIQRGRDHGLPTYATVWAEAQRFLYNKTTYLRSFDSLYETTPDEVVSSLKSVYESVDDVDLFIGGVTEKPLPNALVGPTFAYVIYKQFESLRYGDRFFYDDLSKPVSFTKKQLKEIQKVTFSRILCDNSDGSILNIQGKAFLNAGPSNPLVTCNQIPEMDLTKFAI